MAQIVAEETWVTSLDAERARAAVESFFAQERIEVKSQSAGELTGYQGSQLQMRLLGGAFINPKKLPKRAIVRLEPAGGGTTVTARFEDAVGVGAKTGMKGRYERALSDLLARLKQALPV